jgi:hypothetical protein
MKNLESAVPPNAKELEEGVEYEGLIEDDRLQDDPSRSIFLRAGFLDSSRPVRRNAHSKTVEGRLDEFKETDGLPQQLVLGHAGKVRWGGSGMEEPEKSHGAFASRRRKLRFNLPRDGDQESLGINALTRGRDFLLFLAQERFFRRFLLFPLPQLLQRETG